MSSLANSPESEYKETLGLHVGVDHDQSCGQALTLATFNTWLQVHSCEWKVQSEKAVKSVDCGSGLETAQFLKLYIIIVFA